MCCLSLKEVCDSHVIPLLCMGLLNECVNVNVSTQQALFCVSGWSAFTLIV